MGVSVIEITIQARDNSTKGVQMIIKCLSVKLPWAEMIMNGQKRIEFRTWYRKYRGPLLIVASAKPNIPALGSGNTKLPRKSLCIVDVVDWRPTSPIDHMEPGYPDGGWPEKWYSMILGSRTPVNRLPIKGRLGLFDYDVIDDSIIETWQNHWKYFMNPPF